MMNHPLVLSAAAFFAVALFARYTQADQILSLIIAFPYGVFAYAQTRLHQRVPYPQYRKRTLEYFILFFVLLYALAGIRYITDDLFGEASHGASRLLALFVIGFGMAGVSLGRLNMVGAKEPENQDEHPSEP